MRSLIATLPWALPGFALALVVAVFASRRVATLIGSSRVAAGALIASIGLIIAATIPPDGTMALPALSLRPCDLGRFWLAPLGSYLRFGEISLNVLLFVPLGITLTLLPRGRPKHLLVIGSFVAPWVIESVQLLVPILGRGCQSADVVDNTLGLLVGLAIGLTVKAAASVRSSTRTPH